MPFQVQVGPPQISIHQGQTVLITEETGQINWPSDEGLYFFDTRVVSSWTVYTNGEPWELLNGGAISYYASRIFLTNRSLPTEEGTIPLRTLGLTISRWISGGMHEDLDITNNSQKAVKFQLEIAVRYDFADIFGCAPAADRMHRSHGLHAGRGPPLVHCPFRTRQLDRLVTEHPHLS
jgi:hypothetical protein